MDCRWRNYEIQDKGLSLQLFRLAGKSVLEQYLFFTYQPTTNKVLYASNPEFEKDLQVANKVAELVGKPLWISKKEKVHSHYFLK